MTPSKLAEYRFTHRHNDPMLRRIQQPGERSTMAVVVVLLCVGLMSSLALAYFVTRAF